MIENSDKISLRQLQILLIFDIFGTSVIILPRKVSEYANQDGWIIVIGGMLIALCCAYIVNSLAGLFPKETFVEYSSKIASKPIGIVLSLGLAIKFLFVTGLELKILGTIVKQTMLSNTPPFIVILLMILTSALVSYYGYECRARLFEILVAVAFLPLIVFFILAAFTADFSNLLPAFTSNTNSLINGSFIIALSFSGIEFLLMAYPFVNNAKSIRKSAAHSIIITSVLILCITIITLCRFGPLDTKRKLWPVLQMMDTIHFPGGFIERQDILMLGFWITSVFAIVCAGIYFSSLTLSRIFISVNRTSVILSVLPVIFLISMLPKNISQTYAYIEWINLTFGTFYMFLAPFMLLVIARIRKLGEWVG